MPLIGQKLQPKIISAANGTSKGIHKISPSLLHMAVAIDTLKFDPMNARLHPEKNLAAIKQSLSTFGQVKPIVVRKSTRVIVAGNGTTEAAKGLGWTHIAAIFEDMTSVEAASFGLADNRTAELAKWDFEIVAALEALITEQRSVMIGWTVQQLDDLKIRSVASGEDNSDSLKEKWNVLVECADEESQLILIDRLIGESYECRALTF